MPSDPKQPMYRGRPIGGKRVDSSEQSAPDPERVKAALRKLQKLHEAGEISDADYQSKREALLDALL